MFQIKILAVNSPSCLKYLVTGLGLKVKLYSDY